MNILEVNVQIRRASLLSDKVYGLHPHPGLEAIKEDRQTPKEDRQAPKEDRQAAKDEFYLAALFSFFSGVTSLLPVYFFVIANDYWMYKLRDTAYPYYDLENKTFLQEKFVPVIITSSAVPSVVSVILSAKFGHKLNLRSNFLWTSGIISFSFFVSTVLVKIDTDSWQTEFFVLSMGVFGIIFFALPIYTINFIKFLAKFPLKYMSIYVYGTSVGGLYGSVFQLISLSMTQSSVDGALIYFTSGTLVIIVTLILAYFSKHSSLIEIHSKENPEEPSEKLEPTLKEYWVTMKCIWPLLIMVLVQTFIQGMGYPNITSLVVSEGYVKGGDNLWCMKYFVAVATFLTFNVFQVVGNFFSGAYITKTNHWWWQLINIAWSLLLGPLFMFCNTKPRDHLPVWFPHDYQYIIINAVYSLSLSILTTSQYLSVPKLAGERQTELAYSLFMATFLFASTIFSPLSLFFVNLL